MLRDRDRIIADAVEKNRKLHEDFTYNLQLIEERDAELDRCVGMAGGLVMLAAFSKLVISSQHWVTNNVRWYWMLDRYDVTFARLKEAIMDKEKEISELKINIAELEARKRVQVSRTADIEASYQVRTEKFRLTCSCVKHYYLPQNSSNGVLLMYHTDSFERSER